MTGVKTDCFLVSVQENTIMKNRAFIVRAEALPIKKMLFLLCHREVLGIPTPPNPFMVDNTAIPVVPPIGQGVMSTAPPH